MTGKKGMKRYAVETKLEAAQPQIGMHAGTAISPPAVIMHCTDLPHQVLIGLSVRTHWPPQPGIVAARRDR
jgi:hypothetical protein